MLFDGQFLEKGGTLQKTNRSREPKKSFYRFSLMFFFSSTLYRRTSYIKSYISKKNGFLFKTLSENKKIAILEETWLKLADKER